jgi:recombinational DNA repair protein (RecF pathway)
LTRITEKEAVELASLGLAKLIKDMGFKLEFNSLVDLVQKLTSYEQRHPEIYQDKFKRQITLIDTKDAEDSGEEQEGWLSQNGLGGQISCLESG